MWTSLMILDGVTSCSSNLEGNFVDKFRNWTCDVLLAPEPPDVPTS